MPIQMQSIEHLDSIKGKVQIPSAPPIPPKQHLPGYYTSSKPIQKSFSPPASPVANPIKVVPPLTPYKPQVISSMTIVKPKPVDEKTTPQENQALLRAMTCEDILLLLDNMNLGEYKNNFQREQVDGELMLELSKSDLEDLGVTKNIHQI